MKYISYYNSPLGSIFLASDGKFLTGLWFVNQKYYAKNLDNAALEKNLEIFDLTKKWLDLYFKGLNPDFNIPVKFNGTDFQKRVWFSLLNIPYGDTTTYGKLASLLHTSARAIGTAVGKNPISIIVPCHRVVGKNNSLTGYAGGIDKKEYLLNDIRKLMQRCIFTYTRQNEMKGLGDAVLKAKPLVGDESFGVILADDLCVNEEGIGIMSQMVKIYEKYRCTVVAVMEVDKEHISNYGVIAGNFVEDDLVMVNSMIEKPNPDEAPSNLAIIGRYILTPDIFGILENTQSGKNGEVQLTDALLSQATNNMVLAYKFKGKRFDCGSVEGFVEATNYFYKKELC